MNIDDVFPGNSPEVDRLNREIEHLRVALSEALDEIVLLQDELDACEWAYDDLYEAHLELKEKVHE